MTRLLLIVLVFPVTAVADFTCAGDGSQRHGNDFYVCGTGVGTTEADARSAALIDALAEFRMICSHSADCSQRGVVIDPRRTVCDKTYTGFMCRRLVKVRVSPREVALEQGFSQGHGEINCGVFVVIYPLALVIRALTDPPPHRCFPW